MAVLAELLIDVRLGPISLLKHLEQGIKVQLVDELPLSVSRHRPVRSSHRGELHRPVETSVLHSIVILAHVDHMKLELSTLDVDWLLRVCSLEARDLVYGLVQVLCVLRVLRVAPLRRLLRCLRDHLGADHDGAAFALLLLCLLDR